MFNEKEFMKQCKLFKNSKKEVQTKHDILKEIKLYNEENIVNINMIIDSIEEAEEFVNRVENPNAEWKTITDVIIDVRREKSGEIEGIKIEYIKQLLESQDYIGLHVELERIFLHRIPFATIKQFLRKVDEIGLEKVCRCINEYRINNSYSTTMCYIQQ